MGLDWIGFGEGVAGEGEGRGLPGPRPLPKKRTIGAGVEAVGSDLSQLLVQASGADVLDEGGRVGKQVVGRELGTLAHVPAETQAAGLDPVVRDALEGGSVLGGQLSTRGRWGARSAGVVFDGRGGSEVREKSGPVLSTLEELLQERPVVPFQLTVFPSPESHVGNSQDLVPVSGERHLQDGVGEEQFAGEVCVKLLRRALGVVLLFIAAPQ